MSEDARFIADRMLGKLAKWLRMGGFDTLYARSSMFSDLISVAAREDRMILSRNTNLFRVSEIVKGTVKALYIKEDMVDEQIAQVFDDLGISKSRSFIRCPEDNTTLTPADRQTARQFVPRYVFQTQTGFYRCETCGRYFWAGSHLKGIRGRLPEKAA